MNDAEDIQRHLPPGFVAEGVGDEVGQDGRGLVCIAEFQGKIEAAREARGEGDRPSTIVLQSRPWRTAEFLKPAVSPDGSVATGPDDSALRAGQGEFDATGSLPCSLYVGQPMVQCEFSAARAGGGYATVIIKKTEGRTRAIYFRMGKPIGADTSEADPGEFSARREADLNFVRIGNERYEIPDAVVMGG